MIRSPSGLVTTVASLCTLSVAWTDSASAQPRPGETTEVYVSPYDGRSRHALYLPSNYSAERRWPLVLIMDARGSALLPLQRMVPAAERLGFILMSSYDTASDGPAEPNVAAVEAMLEDAQDLFEIDTRRLYLVGFSGTARQAWIFGRQLASYTHGVIGFGAGLPSHTFLLTLQMAGGPPPFAFFGGSGRLDFNFDEVRRLDQRLDESDIPHQVRFYDGPHDWPEEEVFEEALEWMEVQAIRSGIARADAKYIEVLYESALVRADSLTSTGDAVSAASAYRAAVDGFDGLRVTSEAEEALEGVLESRAYREGMDRLTQLLDERRRFDERFGAFLEDVREDDRPFDVDAAVVQLGLADRLHGADGIGPTALLHRRILESVFVRASFYEPRALMEAGAWARARSFYHLADRIHPDDPRVCLGLARVHAQTGATNEAFEALECAYTSPALGVAELRGDTLLTPLRDDERFQALLRRLGHRR